MWQLLLTRTSGKTTLVDKASNSPEHSVRTGQLQKRVMDSNDIERERGIYSFFAKIVRLITTVPSHQHC